MKQETNISARITLNEKEENKLGEMGEEGRLEEATFNLLALIKE